MKGMLGLVPHKRGNIYIFNHIWQGATILNGCRKTGFEKALIAVKDKVIDVLLENLWDMTRLPL